MSKAIDILENWLENEEQYADSPEELQEVKEVKKALEVLNDDKSWFEVQEWWGAEEGWYPMDSSKTLEDAKEFIKENELEIYRIVEIKLIEKKGY